MGRKVLKFDGPCGPKGCGIALRAMKFLYATCGGGRSWPIEYHFYDSLPAPRSSVGRTKGKRPNGQARCLTSPDLHILCRMCTGDNKAPESEALIMQLYIMHGISSPRSGIYTGTVRPRLHLLNPFTQPSAGLPTFPSPYRFYAAAAWFPAQGMDFLFPPCPA